MFELFESIQIQMRKRYRKERFSNFETYPGSHWIISNRTSRSFNEYVLHNFTQKDQEHRKIPIHHNPAIRKIYYSFQSTWYGSYLAVSNERPAGISYWANCEIQKNTFSSFLRNVMWAKSRSQQFQVHQTINNDHRRHIFSYIQHI